MSDKKPENELGNVYEEGINNTNENNEKTAELDFIDEKSDDNTTGKVLDSKESKIADKKNSDTKLVKEPKYIITENDSSIKKEKKKINLSNVLIYPAILSILAIIFAIGVMTGSQSAVSHSTNALLTRDSLDWDTPPTTMSKSWESEGWKEIVNTPGSIIGVKEDGVYRLDSNTGEELWHYTRSDATVCDAASAGGQLGIVFNAGNGCSDITILDSNTGDYLRTAQYATKQTEAKLIGQADDLLLLTPDHARLLRDDLVTKSEFGSNEYVTNGDDQFVKNCTISDGAISGDGYAIAAKCDDNNTYSIYYLKKDPKESTQAKSVLTIDTKSKSPVTIPVISKAMISFVVPSDTPSVYVWQLTKDQAEVSQNYAPVNSYGFEYQDISGIGYVWRVGQTVNVRHGSEDISQSVKLENAIGDPMVADNLLLVPQVNQVTAWNPLEDTQSVIKIDGFNGNKFAFSGRTIVSFENGVIRGYN